MSYSPEFIDAEITAGLSQLSDAGLRRIIEWEGPMLLNGGILRRFVFGKPCVM